MTILIDECLPRYLQKMLGDGHIVKTVQEMGWEGVENGRLLRLAESQFEIFLTGDKNLRFQQNLKERKLAIVVFPSNKLSVVKKLQQQLTEALTEVDHGEYIELKASKK